MTRRDFELIAAAVRDAGRNGYTDHVARSLASALVSSNPWFDRDRFLRACRNET